MSGHEARCLQSLPSSLRLGRNLEDDDAFARRAALAREADSSLAVLLGQAALERPGDPEQLRSAANEDLAFAAGAPARAEILEAHATTPRRVQEILPDSDAGTAYLGLEDSDRLRQAGGESRDPT